MYIQWSIMAVGRWAIHLWRVESGLGEPSTSWNLPALHRGGAREAARSELDRGAHWRWAVRKGGCSPTEEAPPLSSLTHAREIKGQLAWGHKPGLIQGCSAGRESPRKYPLCPFLSQWMPRPPREALLDGWGPHCSFSPTVSWASLCAPPRQSQAHSFGWVALL